MIKKILISQPKPGSDKSPYYEIAKDLGIEMVFRPGGRLGFKRVSSAEN